MGYMRHHSILVSVWSKDRADEIYERAKCEFGDEMVTMNSKPLTNGYWIIHVMPDGSKEGWDTSDEFDESRDRFVEYLDEFKWCDYAIVQWADDDGDNRVVRVNTETEE